MHERGFTNSPAPRSASRAAAPPPAQPLPPRARPLSGSAGDAVELAGDKMGRKEQVRLIIPASLPYSHISGLILALSLLSTVLRPYPWWACSTRRSGPLTRAPTTTR